MAITFQFFQINIKREKKRANVFDHQTTFKSNEHRHRQKQKWKICEKKNKVFFLFGLVCANNIN